MKAKRASLTPKERKAMFVAQRKLCGCGCGGTLRSWSGIDAIGEHVHEFVALGCAEKPDALYLPECAKRKTNGPRGDLNTISHVKQLAEGRTQYDKRKLNGSRLRSRNTLAKGKMKKRFDGSVVKR